MKLGEGLLKNFNSYRFSRSMKKEQGFFIAAKFRQIPKYEKSTPKVSYKYDSGPFILV